MNQPNKIASEKLIWPLLISLGVFLFFYFGEDNQTFGLAAVDSTRRALRYVLGVVAFLSLGVLAQRVIQYVIFEGLIARTTGTPVPKLLSQISGLVIYLISLAACAGIIFNQDLTVVWAASGVAGLVLGMALRELLQDVFAGIALNIDRAVRIGDYVQLHRAGDAVITGQLLEISWRTTQIKDTSGDVVVLPNSKFSGYTITNFSRPKPVGTRKFSVMLDAAIPQSRSLRILQAATMEALISHRGPEAPPPQIRIKDIKADGVDYEISFEADWAEVADLRPLMYQHVLEHLAQAGIEPIRKGPPPSKNMGLPDTARLMALIEQTPLFRGFAEDDLRLLAEGARMRVELADRVIVQAGEAGTQLYLVLEGLLVASTGRRQGARPTLPAMLRPGDLFDASALFLGDAHLSTVRTRTPALICEFEHALVQRLFQASGTAFDNVARQLAEQYAKNSLHMADVADDLHRQMRHIFPGAGTLAAKSAHQAQAHDLPATKG